jgi:hypothetical protein
MIPAAIANADVPVRFVNAQVMSTQFNQQAVVADLQKHFGKEDLREITVRQEPGFLIARLHSARFHKFESVRMDQSVRGFNYTRNYRPLAKTFKPKCPDTKIEFISFAPNDNDFEQGIAREVADAAKSKSLNTILLLGQDATREAYINYMSCPNLKGNFYDGDSNPYEMVTADDSVTAEDYQNLLKGAFRFKVTNIWLACEAFNDPMKSSLLEDAQAQKYAAGINDLLVGPSDKTAACTMEAGINGQALTAAFNDCKQNLDDPQDQWGFDGHGSDMFGQ